jgi:hypothetical protein
MPSKHCHVCGRIVEYSRKDWPYISRLESAVCSRGCAWEFILNGPEGAPGYLSGAIPTPPYDPPSASHSNLLGMMFRSDYERHVAEAFSDSGIAFEYEKWMFPVKEGAFWTPDFHLPQYKKFVEVKGQWGTSAKSKVTSFLKLHPGVSLLILPWTIHKEFYELYK